MRCEPPVDRSRRQRVKQPLEEKALMKHVKTLRIYSVGNWEPSRDFGAEEWQNVIFVF